jgi:hypothetical protein
MNTHSFSARRGEISSVFCRDAAILRIISTNRESGHPTNESTHPFGVGVKSSGERYRFAG